MRELPRHMLIVKQELYLHDKWITEWCKRRIGSVKMMNLDIKFPKIVCFPLPNVDNQDTYAIRKWLHRTTEDKV